MEESDRGLIQDTVLEYAQRDTMVNLSQDGRPPNRDLIPGPPETKQGR
jgi:hypothetical protein